MSVTRFDPPCITCPPIARHLQSYYRSKPNTLGTSTHIGPKWPGHMTGQLRSLLSVIVPARNEAANLPRLVAEIVHALRPLCRNAQYLGESELVALRS